MHGKVEDMHRHVQIAYKMKKVAEKNLSKTVGDLQMNQMERETEINELKKRISEMREEHERYHSRSEQKMAKLRNALRNSQADLSGLEIHLHQYEKQVNRLQAQIELLRRNMLTSQRGIHHTTEVVGQTNPSDLSPLSCLTTESSTYSGHSYSRRRRTPESYYTALQNYTPSILDALNIDMI
jgi:predicted RNase H-like nuclease (RuvC/YqgF family)